MALAKLLPSSCQFCNESSKKALSEPTWTRSWLRQALVKSCCKKFCVVDQTAAVGINACAVQAHRAKGKGGLGRAQQQQCQCSLNVHFSIFTPTPVSTSDLQLLILIFFRALSLCLPSRHPGPIQHAPGWLWPFHPDNHWDLDQSSFGSLGFT